MSFRRLIYNLSFFLMVVFYSITVSAALPDVNGVTGAYVNENNIAHVLHVSTDGNDNNPGTLDLPLLSINKAADLAGQYQQNNEGSRIIIHPGIYRETIDALIKYPVTVSLGAAIIFEPYVSGTVTISASEVYSDWQQVEADVYRHSWAYDWGLWVDIPVGGAQYEKDIFLNNPILRRREMFFVDGELLAQALNYSELEQLENSFFVDEGNDLVYIHLTSGTNVNALSVEGAERMHIFRTYRNRSLVVRGLKFEHATNVIFGNGAVHFEESEDIVFEDNVVQWCNGIGWAFQGNSVNSGGGPLHYYPCERITARRNVANYNGIAGAKTHLTRNTLFEDNVTSYNNWRGVIANLTWGWTGTRFYLMHDAILRRHTSVGNHARGIWFDTDADNILVENCNLSENVDGLKFEVCQGPILVDNCYICDNSRSGILFHVNREITVRNSQITGNVLFQLEVSSSQVSKYLTDWYLEQPAGFLDTGDLSFYYNIVGGSGIDQQNLIYCPNFTPFLTTFLSDDNYYFHTNEVNVFHIESDYHDFSSWQALTDQDPNSIFSDSFPTPAYCGDFGTRYSVADVDKDCKVNLQDVAAVSAMWGENLTDYTTNRSYIIEPRYDTTFDSTVWPYTNDGSTATVLTNYIWNSGSNEKRCSLMMFDITCIDPSITVQVQQAFLFVHVNDYRHNGDTNVSGRVHGWKFHRMLVPWSEDDTYGTLNGLREGIEYDSSAFATFVHEGNEGPGDKFIPGFEKAIANWLDGSWENYGFIILSFLPTGGTSFNAVTFRSREFITYPNDNPLLVATTTAKASCDDIITQIPEDINNDCSIDLADISLLALEWLETTIP
ncbi:MAG: right-handed parallel beta-helix repeat-containing protein [Phycisphaerae bacterium]|nr:right-handed parallel beta-helix repeat-containing protein [Phycisphaerae bacterium]